MAARLGARVFRSKMLRNMSFVLSLLKTNCSPITKPKPRYSHSGSPIPLQDISTCHERLFFFSFFDHTKTGVPTESCLVSNSLPVSYNSSLPASSKPLVSYTTPLAKLPPLPRECAPAALSSLSNSASAASMSHCFTKEWQVSSHALGPPRRPDPASKSPLQTVFLRRCYCLLSGCMQGRGFTTAKECSGAREENVASTPCSVSGTCSECCAPQTSLSRSFFVLLDIGGPGACQVLTVAQHSRLSCARHVFAVSPALDQGRRRTSSRSQGAQHQRDLMSSQHRCCPRDATLLLLCFGAQQKRSTPHVFAPPR
jgi:hypothetical protein